MPQSHSKARTVASQESEALSFKSAKNLEPVLSTATFRARAGSATLFLELTRRGDDLSSLRENTDTTAEIIKIE